MRCSKSSYHRTPNEYHGGVKKVNPKNNLCLLVKFNYTTVSSRLWDTPYSEYQQYLYDRVCDLRSQKITPMSYLKIAALFRSEGLLTHSGKEFKATHVFSIYKKGKVREERLNRPNIMEVGQVSIYQIWITHLFFN
jgi:hypothetical protein